MIDSVKTKNRWLGFTIFILFYIVVFLGTIVGGMIFLWDYMDAYERSRPYHALDAYMAKLDGEYVCDQSAELIAGIDHGIQTAEECRQVIQNALRGGISYAKKVSECTDTRLVYVLRSGGKVIGEMEMTPQGEAVHGFTPWAVTADSFDLSFLLTGTVSATVPSQCSVYVNGKPLGDEYITETGIQYPALAEYYADYIPPYQVRYQAGPCLGEISIQVKDPQGNDLVIDENTDLTPLMENCTEDEMTLIEAFLDTYFSRYVRFTSTSTDREANYRNLVACMVPNGTLAKRMKQAIDGLKYANLTPDKLVSISRNWCVNLGGGRYLCDVTYVVDVSGHAGVVSKTNNVKLILLQTEDGLKAESMLSY